MATFIYTALDSQGRKTSGIATAQNRMVALEQLAAQGLAPVNLDERKDHPKSGGHVQSFGRVSQAHVEAFNRELGNLLAAAVPMSKALRILCRETAHPAARRQWMAIHEDVTGGTSLADAMAKWPGSFPDVYVAMVRAGETGGFLDVVLGQIADFRARERDLMAKVKGALAYPLVLCVLAVAVIAFLMTYFIPRFSAIFADFGAALPTLTRAIVAVSEAIIQYGLLFALSALLSVLLIRRAMKSESGRLAAERMLLRTPGLGRAVARFALVRFCRVLGTLLSAGVPLIAALRVAREAIGNQTLADAIGSSIEQVQQGRPLARSLAACPELFPPSVVEMVAVAEESGRLDVELSRLATVYEVELDRRLRMLVSLAEPALLFMMAGIVGIIVIGMMLPVFTLQELIR